MSCSENKIHSFVDGLSDDEFNILLNEIEARFIYEKFKYNRLSDYALSLGRTPICPYCNSDSYYKNGYANNDEPRYKCNSCNRTYTLLQNSIFYSTKKKFYDWYKFIELIVYDPTLELEENVLNLDHKTVFLWRHKVFHTVNKYQDNIILKDKVWIDEIYIEDLNEIRLDGKHARGLSKYKKCIIIAIDKYKNIIAIESGNGKISSNRFSLSLEKHIYKESIIVHDGEHSHKKLIDKLELKDEFHKANVKDDEYLKSMELINSLSSWIKRYLNKHIGMDINNLQTYLNWYVYLFKVKKENEKYPKIERIIRHLLLDSGQFKR